jgi:hypothetical protein
MTLSIQLASMTGNAFVQYPQLQSIWPSPYVECAMQATAEDWDACGPLLVLADLQVVGVTGLFYEDEDPDNAFLRWTGIVPYMRRRNIASKMLDLVCAMAVNHGNRTGYLIELLPDNEYGEQQRPFFDAAGFVELKPLKHEHTDWPVKVLGLSLKPWIRE